MTVPTRCSEAMGELVVPGKISECFCTELWPVIRDDCFGDTMSGKVGDDPCWLSFTTSMKRDKEFPLNSNKPVPNFFREGLVEAIMG